MAFIELVTFQVRFSGISLVMELITLSTIIKYEIKMKRTTVKSGILSQNSGCSFCLTRKILLE